jgi:hypothetical protein
MTGVRFPSGLGSISENVQIGLGAHLASYPVGTGLLASGINLRAVELMTQTSLLQVDCSSYIRPHGVVFS